MTNGINENIGEIKSTVDYPTHSNYIPLWEVTSGDRSNATDMRPEVRRFGKKNSVIYFDGNGEEHEINLDAASIGKFFMSNGESAPSFENPSGNVEIQSTQNRYIAGEDLLKGDYVYNDMMSIYSNADTDIAIGDDSSRTRQAFRVISNG